MGRAFGPPEISLEPVSRAERETLDAGFLGVDLAGRIWERTPRSILVKELTPDQLEEFEARFHASVALSLRHQEVARRVVEIAADENAQVLLLKGLALQLGGYSPPGSRLAADVDLLLSPVCTESVFQRLLEEGSQSLDLPAEPHHLRPLRHPLGSTVELHLHLRGVSLGGARMATLPDCVGSDHCVPVPEFADGACIPSRELMIAHLLVHGVGQHGSAPESYPMVQLLGDLQDLGVGKDGFSLSGNLQLLEWVGASVSQQEVVAVEELLGLLESGELPSRILEGSRPSSILLRHIVAGQVREDYRQSLKLGRQLGTAAGPRSMRTTLRNAGRALWLTDGQVDIIYGPSKSRFGYLGWRLWRPIDLLARSAKSAWSWLKVRSRKAK